MKQILMFVLILPLFSEAQQNLTGIWKLKESKNIKGPDYINAIPISLIIEHKSDVIVLETTFNNGEKDSTTRESFFCVERGIKEDTTKSGRKKITSFQRKMNEGYWLKETTIFTKEDPTRLQSVSKEIFKLSTNGSVLSMQREYDGNDDSKGTQDFSMEGKYEKTTAEELTKETGTGKGVDFTQGLSWKQIKTKAKNENKYIFVDCYATWCRPCKMMDRYVYPLNLIGEAMNDQFISVKVQMDSTKNDADHIKMLYPLARKLEKKYSIAALPSYLFFSSNGEAVHKAIGQQDAKKFMKLLDNARSPEHQLYTLFNKAKERVLPYKEYPALAKRLKKEFYEKQLATEVATIYYREYLNKLSETELLAKPNLDFLDEYSIIVKSSDKIFQLCLKQPELVDTIKRYEWGSWADGMIKKVIIREEVKPIFNEANKSNKDPDWTKLEKVLVKKYNKRLAITYVLDARVDWYEKKQNWTFFLQYLKPHLARHDLKKMDEEHLHYCAWYVFKYSNDIMLIKEALEWMEILIKKTPAENLWATMDTKACLIYKLGKKDEGIATMRRIIAMFPDQRKGFQPRLDSMIKDEEIWLTF